MECADRVWNVVLAERVGFEPTVPLRVLRISSAVHSTTLPPLRRSRADAGSARIEGAMHSGAGAGPQALAY
jgi:hypothetical protein